MDNRGDKSIRGSGKARLRKRALAGASNTAERLVNSLIDYEEDEDICDPPSDITQEDNLDDHEVKKIRLSAASFEEPSPSCSALLDHEPNSAPAASSLLKPTEESLDYHVSDHSNRYLVEPFEVNRSDSDSSSSGDDSSSNDESDSTDILDHDSFITAVDPVVAQINKAKSIRLLSLAYYLKHGISKAALKDFLAVINIASEGVPSKELRSPFTLFQPYEHLKRDIKRIYVCRRCPKLLVNGQDGFPLKQQPCGHPYSRSEQHCYTLLLDVEHQVKYFLEHYEIKKRSYNAEKIGDVTSGKCYKACTENTSNETRILTLQANIDGAQMYESSKWNFWPFMVLINEADYHIRRDNIILVGIQHCEGKPIENAFIVPCVDRLRKLEETGIEFNGEKYEIRLLIISTDTVARPVLRNTTQFNGKFGCDFCLHPGYSVSRDGGKRALHCYCETNDKGVVTKYPLRTMEQHMRDVEAVMKKKGKDPRVHGIKGASALLEIENFDMIKAFVPEYMHSMCLGVIKMYVHLWMDKTIENKKQPWFIGDKAAIINSRLSNVLPPMEIKRTPSKDYILKTAFWKAHEYKAFGLYYYPILEGILPEPYFSHFSLFSHGLYILLQEEVDLESVKQAGVLFDHFVTQSEKLYGRARTTYNLHLVTHLSQSSQDWGCLWASSTFLPEWFNGQLQGMVHGTQAPVEQMVSTLLIRSAVRDEVITLLKDPSVSLPKATVSQFKSLLHLPPSILSSHGLYIKHRKVMSNNLSLLGQPSSKYLSADERESIKNFILQSASSPDFDFLNPSTSSNFIQQSLHSVALFYPRIELVNGVVFTTNAYTRSRKRLNYCAFLKSGIFIYIQSIVVIPQLSDQHCFILGNILGNEGHEYYVPNQITMPSNPANPIIIPQIPGQLVKLRGKSSVLSAFDCSCLQKKCVITMRNDLSGVIVAAALANSVETD